MIENIIQDRRFDYANKNLPDVPEHYDVDERNDDDVIVVHNAE
jgi:hypothetical protein